MFTICSIYAPPNKYIDIKDLEHLLSQMSEPVMLLGDFNSHNPLWGSEHLTPKGRVIENFISQNDLCLFNDGSPTFLHSVMVHTLQLIYHLQVPHYSTVLRGMYMTIVLGVIIFPSYYDPLTQMTI